MSLTRSRRSAGTASWRRSRPSAPRCWRQRSGAKSKSLSTTIDAENGEAVARSPWDAPEIDGNVFLPDETAAKPGDLIRARIIAAEEYDLIAERC